MFSKEACLELLGDNAYTVKKNPFSTILVMHSKMVKDVGVKRKLLIDSIHYYDTVCCTRALD
jgi:hypothetical protein